jgi:hypothetical protein
VAVNRRAIAARLPPLCPGNAVVVNVQKVVEVFLISGHEVILACIDPDRKLY